MKVLPLHDYVLVECEEMPETSAEGIYIPGTAQRRLRHGTVIASGPGLMKENGTVAPVRVKQGDKVLFHYGGAGTEIEIEGSERGKKQLLLTEGKLLAVIKD